MIITAPSNSVWPCQLVPVGFPNSSEGCSQALKFHLKDRHVIEILSWHSNKPSTSRFPQLPSCRRKEDYPDKHSWKARLPKEKVVHFKLGQVAPTSLISISSHRKKEDGNSRWNPF